MLEINRIYPGDCLDVMQDIDDKSIDMVLCDLPYGTTKCKWDIVIPFEPLWKQYKRIIKDRGAIVLFGIEPFSSYLRISNIKMYKYDWYWKKSKPVGFLNARRMPLKNIETISVFSSVSTVYSYQGTKVSGKRILRSSSMMEKGNYISTYNGGTIKKREYIQKEANFPTQFIEMPIEGKPIHPTQKPVPLFEYLIKTYTNEGELVLDNASGSALLEKPV